MPCRQCAFWKRRSAEQGVCWHERNNGADRHQHETCEAFQDGAVLVVRSTHAGIASDLVGAVDFEVRP